MRKECPYCGSTNVTEVDDKEKVLFYHFDGSKIYAKKMYCKSCGYGDWK